jgi:hypothetical protein
MVNQKRNVGLITFLKGSSNPVDKMPGCANFDHHYGECLEAETCSVKDGNRCQYFEAAVLPTAADIGQLERITKLYQKQIGIEQEHIEIRKCPDCQTELRPRERYCSDCKRKRRLETKRQTKRKRQVRSRQLS